MLLQCHTIPMLYGAAHPLHCNNIAGTLALGSQPLAWPAAHADVVRPFATGSSLQQQVPRGGTTPALSVVRHRGAGARVLSVRWTWRAGGLWRSNTVTHWRVVQTDNDADALCRQRLDVVAHLDLDVLAVVRDVHARGGVLPAGGGGVGWQGGGGRCEVGMGIMAGIQHSAPHHPPPPKHTRGKGART